ncbi:hypothetical protein MKW92_037429 [Papaver armeniacum]|nr:hypothetical protein MKW92_037429 [Papaver armeniacum]
MNPSDLIESDAFVIQPYPKYEALAEKSQKVLNNCSPSGSARKLRQEDIYVKKVDELMGGMSMWKKTKELKRKGRNKDPETNIAPKSLRNLVRLISMWSGRKFISILEDYNKQRISDPLWSVVDLLALQQIEHARSICCTKEQLPPSFSVKAGICHAHLGNIEQAENLFRNLKHNGDNTGLITAVGNTFMNLWHYVFALRCYFMLEEIDQNGNSFLHIKISCKLLTFFNKSLGRNLMEGDVDALLTLDEVIKFLSPSEDLASTTDTSSRGLPNLGGMMQQLQCNLANQKARSKKKLSKSILCKRVKLLDNHHADDVFRGFRPLGAPSENAAMKEERKAAAITAGLDWHNDEHYKLILNLCKAFVSLRRYWEALEIINHSLRLADNILPFENREELRSLGAQIAYATGGPTSGYDYARFIVQQHSCSFADWNCYYKVICRLENRLAKPVKFLHNMRCTHTLNIQHQASAGEYLEAYKLMPDLSLINVCVGTALINVALGLGLQNKDQCLAQGFALSLAIQDFPKRAGLVTLAVTYFVRVLKIQEKDHPIPKDAAYNLHLIYKKSGALDLGRQVQKDHCTL